MVVHHIGQKVEPEARKLREHLALIGDFVFQNIVESRNTIGCDQQQLVAQIVQIAHLALRVGGDVDSRHGTPFLLDEPERRPSRSSPSGRRSNANARAFFAYRTLWHK